MHTQELLTPENLDKELNVLIEAAHVLGSDRSLVLPGSSSVSATLEAFNLFGQVEKVLFVSGRDQKLAAITSRGFSSFVNQQLVDLIGFESISNDSIEYELQVRRLPGSNSNPPIDLFLHAIIPASFVFFTQPVSLTAISSTENGKAALEGLFKKNIAVLPYRSSGLPLAKSILQAYGSTRKTSVQGFFVLNQGLVTFGDTPQEAVEKIKSLDEQAVQYIKDKNAWKISVSSSSTLNNIPRQDLAVLRKALSDQAKAPLILKTWRDPESLSLVEADGSTDPAPCLPSHLPGYKYLPLNEYDIGSYRSAYSSRFPEKDVAEYFDSGDVSPRIILDPAFGLCSAGRTAGEAVANAEYFTHSMQVLQRSLRLGSYTPISFKTFMAEKQIDSLMGRRSGELPPFTGEIALVTGAASGIGKACANSLLERGAVVVGLDISKTIEGSFNSENFLGLVCDIGDEAAVKNAVDRTTLAFGGLDMLILNAGIFPAGCRIDAMDMAEWEKVMRINLHGNMALMREAYPLLKLAPHHGRMVINGSRNVKAPGPGASAYSASKAALTQLARVAALEWGKDGIRVNVVHPNAVFDTALYTEDVLKARAASYGITVEQYKKNNVLSVEITSRDVGEMVAEMCGPLFAKVTGTQISIDGGSDRVI
jgi:NAD(P)-dependent dehydrogenase (short-subunit alcohol dehydrogenase family)/rhamnose utilization protein RhaD (predicted bifunctional aldolase and dehydrogenase)